MSSEIADYCDPSIGNYGYVPSLGGGVFFSIVFGLLTLYAAYATVRQRLWFLAIVLGGILETLGWIGRSLAHSNICSQSVFILQICTLITAPAFFSAALYIVLGILIQKARQLSILSPRMYIILFCSLDFLSLLLQAIGGGLASSATTFAQQDVGTDIMVAGVFIQIAGMAIFTALGASFLYQATRQRVRFNRQVLTVSITSTVLIFIRNIYRTVELLGGWTGYVNTTEGFLIGLDGVCMLLCMLCLSYLIVIDATTEDACLARKMTPPSEKADQEGQVANSDNGSDSIA